MKENYNCPICNHETFINEYGDIQCSGCRRILPIDIEREKKESEVDTK
jgi:transcription elongation factor Elf1